MSEKSAFAAASEPAGVVTGGGEVSVIRSVASSAFVGSASADAFSRSGETRPLKRTLRAPIPIQTTRMFQRAPRDGREVRSLALRMTGIGRTGWLVTANENVMGESAHHVARLHVSGFSHHPEPLIARGVHGARQFRLAERAGHEAGGAVHAASDVD